MSLYTICSASNSRQTTDFISFINLTYVLTLLYDVLFFYYYYYNMCYNYNNLPLVGLTKLSEEEDYLVSLAAKYSPQE